jgi:hypothetical protein
VTGRSVRPPEQGVEPATPAGSRTEGPVPQTQLAAVAPWERAVQPRELAPAAGRPAGP